MEQQPNAAARGEEKKPKSFGRRITLRHVPPAQPLRIAVGIFERAAQLLFPWSEEDYPGIGKGPAGLLGRGYETVRSWRYGRRRPPIEALEKLESELRARAERDLAMAAELQEAIKRYPEEDARLKAEKRAGARRSTFRRWYGPRDDKGRLLPDDAK